MADSEPSVDDWLEHEVGNLSDVPPDRLAALGAELRPLFALSRRRDPQQPDSAPGPLPA